MQTTQQYEDIKEQINALIAQLPAHESGPQRALMMAIDLQQKLQDAIEGNADNKQDTISKITSDVKALDLLIDLNKKVSDMYSALTDKGKEQMSFVGQGIRNHIKSKNAAIKGSDDSGVHKTAGS